MTFGDLLEWLAAIALTVAAFIWSGLVLALAVAGVSLFYLAQVYSGARIRRRQKRDDS